MSPVEIAQALVRSLTESAGLLAKMRAGMQQRRTQWISARPSALAEPAEAMAGIAAELARLEEGRERLLAEARTHLPAVAGAAGPRRVRIQDLAARLPQDLAARLRGAAQQAAAAAKDVRREVAFGQRLLRFQQTAHESLLAGITKTLADSRDDVGSYDRNARRLTSALPRAGAAPGGLLDGRA